MATTIPPMRRSTDLAPSACSGGCEELLTMEQRLQDGDARMTRIEMLLEQTCKDTSEALDIVRLGKSFFRLAGYTGVVIKWGAGIGVSLLMLYYAIRDWPKH